MEPESMIDDETLSAWLDGALESDRLDSVSRMLEQSPESQRRLGLMLLNEQVIKRHFGQMAAERPVPEPLLALLETDPEPARGSWLRSLNDWLAGINLGPGFAAATIAVALVIGILTGSQGWIDAGSSNPAGLTELTAIDAGHDWYGLLESTPSGETRTLADGRQGLVALSFQSADDVWCRQFHVQQEERSEGIAAVACRDNNEWQIRLAQQVERLPATAEHFATASAADLSALDAYIMQKSRGDVLVGTPEAAMIRAGWQ